MCFKRIIAFFQKDIKEEKPEVEERLVRIITTGRGGPNMPKYQPCPNCHGGAQRESKTPSGANYWCEKCKLGFFVSRPRRKPRRSVYQHSK